MKNKNLIFIALLLPLMSCGDKFRVSISSKSKVVEFQRYRGSVNLSFSRNLQEGSIKFRMKFSPYEYKSEKRIRGEFWSNEINISVRKRGHV